MSTPTRAPRRGVCRAQGAEHTGGHARRVVEPGLHCGGGSKDQLQAVAASQRLPEDFDREVSAIVDVIAVLSEVLERVRRVSAFRQHELPLSLLQLPRDVHEQIHRHIGALQQVVQCMLSAKRANLLFMVEEGHGKGGSARRAFSELGALHGTVVRNLLLRRPPTSGGGRPTG